MTNKSKSDTKKLIVQIIEMLPAKYRKMVLVAIPVVVLGIPLIATLAGCHGDGTGNKELCTLFRVAEETADAIATDTSGVQVIPIPVETAAPSRSSALSNIDSDDADSSNGESESPANKTTEPIPDIGQNP